MKILICCLFLFTTLSLAANEILLDLTALARPKQYAIWRQKITRQTEPFSISISAGNATWEGLPLGVTISGAAEIDFLDSIPFWNKQVRLLDSSPETEILAQLAIRNPGNAVASLPKLWKQYLRNRYGASADAVAEYYRIGGRTFQAASLLFDEESRGELLPCHVFNRTKLEELESILLHAEEAVLTENIYVTRLRDLKKNFRNAQNRVEALRTNLIKRMRVYNNEIQNLNDICGKEKYPTTTVTLRTDTNNLTIIVNAEEPFPEQIKTKHFRRDEPGIWDDDCVEIFLVPEPDRPPYAYQFIVNTMGVIWDGRKTKRGGDASWNAEGANAVSEKFDRGWRITLTIPWHAFGFEAPPTEPWLANFNRNRQVTGKCENFFWAPTYSPGYYQPEHFGILEWQPNTEKSKFSSGCHYIGIKTEPLPNSLQIVQVNNPEQIGDIYIIRTPDNQITLVDTGLVSTSESVLIPALESRGIHHIDKIILTHQHSDHVGGLVSLLADPAFSVEEIIWSPVPQQVLDEKAPSALEKRLESAYLLLAYQRGIPIREIKAGDILKLGKDVNALILASARPENYSANFRNNNSIVFRLTYGDFSMLFTGDAGFEAEKMLLESGIHLRSDVLKVAHHAGAQSSSAEFIAMCSPQILVTTMPEWLSYDPRGIAAETRLFKKKRIPFFRSWEYGDLIIFSDGKSFGVTQTHSFQRSKMQLPESR